MDEPNGTVPCHKSIQDYVRGIVEFDEFRPHPRIWYRLVVGIHFLAIGLGYWHRPIVVEEQGNFVETILALRKDEMEKNEIKWKRGKHKRL